MALADPGERRAVAETAVADAIDLVRAGADDEARPQRVHAVAGTARRPVQRRLHVHLEIVPEVDRIAPVDGGGDKPGYALLQDSVVAERSDDAWAEALPKPADRVHVHVVVVIVRDEHGIDGGQVVEVDARRVHALRARKRDRTGALGPDGI